MAFLPGNFGQRVEELRVKAGLNQTQLALQLGVNKGTISRMENNELKSIGSDILDRAGLRPDERASGSSYARGPVRSHHGGILP